MQLLEICWCKDSIGVGFSNDGGDIGELFGASWGFLGGPPSPVIDEVK